MRKTKTAQVIDPKALSKIKLGRAARLALRRLATRGGVITPGIVVEAARDEGSPLHQFFTWDDTIAAERYRLEQARGLIRTCKVVETITENDITIKLKAPAWSRDPRQPAHEQGYVHVDKLKTSAALAKRAMDLELSRVEAMLKRCESLALALGLVDHVERVRAAVVELHTVVKRRKAG